MIVTIVENITTFTANAFNTIPKPDFEGVENFKTVIQEDTTWWKSTIDSMGTYIEQSILNGLKSMFTWLVVTGQTIMYWIATAGGIYSAEKYALSRDRTVWNPFYKFLIIYIFLTLICTIL